MKKKHKKITKETLVKWNACKSGYDRFNELFPKGADLRTASDGLISDGKPNWSDWLWSNCKNSQDEDYIIQTTATAGFKGILIIKYWDTENQRYRRKVAVVGENGIKPNVAYKIDKDNNFVEVKA